MATITTKQLASKEFVYGDGAQDVHRYAVRVDGVRIGTVYHTINRASGYQVFVPWYLAPGRYGLGRPVTVDYIVQVRNSLEEAAAIVAARHAKQI